MNINMELSNMKFSYVYEFSPFEVEVPTCDSSLC